MARVVHEEPRDTVVVERDSDRGDRNNTGLIVAIIVLVVILLLIFFGGRIFGGNGDGGSSPDINVQTPSSQSAH